MLFGYKTKWVLLAAMIRISVCILKKPIYSILNKSIREPKKMEKKISWMNKTTKCSRSLWILSFLLFKNFIKEVS